MEKTTEKVKILSAGAIAAMLRRMAYEIYERNYGESTLVLAGIGARGAFLADRIAMHLEEISPLKVIRQDIQKPEGDQSLRWVEAPVAEALQGATVLLIDDVLYSGSTVMQALVLAIGFHPAKIQTLFLIDRGHHQYPVTHDYVGMEMATSLKQYISVEVDPLKLRAEAFIY